MTAYYNEIDPFAAQWLRNLIAAGLIAPGDVDERSIEDVRPDDLAGYRQCHFFAGIGGWSLALRMAGWSDDEPVWTGSCPCQPFSTAGKQRGSEDARHLWPAFFCLIRERRPPAVFGEQVSGASGLAWLDHVCADLEGEGYATAASDLCAASVGAPHIRQRLYWVAHDGRARLDFGNLHGSIQDKEEREEGGKAVVVGCQASGDYPLSNTVRVGQPRQGRLDGPSHPTTDSDRQVSGVVDAGRRYWRNARPVDCADGTKRLLEPGILPLAYGVPARVGRLRGYGNAIVPQVAAAFIECVMELENT